MHPNPIFRRAPDQLSLDFARERGFGLLALNGAASPALAHLPFVLDSQGRQADLHLVRSNPVLALLDEPAEASLVVSGPDGYVSPDWYGIPDQVPTWNYVAVHLRGRLERLPREALAGVLDAQSAHAEAQLSPKAPWTAAKMTPGARDKMMRAIVPCRLHVQTVEGTWKMSQNKPGPAREGAVRGMEAGGGPGLEVGLMAMMMAADGLREK
ncbi:FMN-binding negative transcriptional regulator [Profundibacterium mesophilum]|uniref:FMN-binding domain containing protein n=1 Tax=Profundibacterium mesophilum KAUST100406-0324 TaxID=1037889 RepID=A0A921TDP1_9RHOB|nr:FMN-binding negative transcriptional regulator [Profundibacterium mesophilum]KAF0676422.1 putative FMN-binding domain containing protein [Profundibacterium mesophilum KAUST100406-0324]